jgi:glycosyltransferase involved in cell wall biosynthesis
MVLLEAMQSKLPIVSTNEGGIPNLVDDGKTGFLIKKHDINALAEKIELLITDKKLRLSMGLAGHDKYKKEYTLEKYNARLIEIFNKILAG